MDKYYKPEIEEFHVGFEYERFVPKANATEEECWDKLSMSVNYLSLDEIDDEIIEKEIRVKYLDKEDIESLGWKLNSDLYIKDGLTLQLHKDLITIKYYDDFNNEWRTKVEQITIKNKSELVKLLKQLGIE